MSPAEQARWYRQARESLIATPIGSTDGHAVVAAALRRLELEAEAPIVFKHLGGDRWEVHRSCDTAKVYRCSLKGLIAAHAAIRAAGLTTVRVSDYTKPGARSPDNAVRNAIRGPAIEWVERRCPELARALRSVRVHGGVVSYEPSRGAVAIDVY